MDEKKIKYYSRLDTETLRLASKLFQDMCDHYSKKVEDAVDHKRWIDTVIKERGE